MFFAIVSLFATFLASIYLAIFSSVGVLILYFKLKKTVQKMDQEKWQHYFIKINGSGIFLRMIASFLFVLAILAILETIFLWQGNYYYGITLFLAGIFHIIYKMRTKPLKMRFKL